MEQIQQNNSEALEPQQAAAKAALLAECERLAAAGVTFVAVHFDGYGDEGTTEEVKCYSSEWYAAGEHEPVKYVASYLQEHFESLVPFGSRQKEQSPETAEMASTTAVRVLTGTASATRSNGWNRWWENACIAGC